MITFYTLLNWLILFGYWLLIAGVTLRIMMKRRTVPSAMAWLLVIYILPLVGICAYLLLGELNLGRRRVERAKALWTYIAKWFNELNQCNAILATEVSKVAQPLMQLCERRNGVRGLKGNQLQLLTSTSNSLKSIMRDITQAQENIEMVFYIWQPGGLADQVAQTLMAAANRGIRCRLLLDSAGSHAFFRSDYPSQMRAAGIEVEEALRVNPFRAFFRRMDLRQHRKIVLIDNQIAYTGSMNMVDPRYFKQSVGVGQWVDLMVRMQGPIASMLGALYSYDWEMETGERTLPELPTPHQLLFADEPGHVLQMIASGPGFPEDLIHQALLTAIYAARQQLTMTTPYFVPSDDLLHAICTAAMRGVSVSLIVPAKNDSLMVGWACRSFFSELLRAGVKIYQFTGGLLHTKSVLVDQQLSLLGTVNLDMRSLWLNFENTVVIDDPTCGTELAAIQANYIAQSTLLDSTQWEKRPFWQRLVERLFFFFSPLL